MVNSMKIALSGKGGVGKTTLAAALALLLARKGQRVVAVDADPDANLAAALGIPPEKQHDIVPISRKAALIEERTGAKVKQYGQIFKLNPHVSDIAEDHATLHQGVALLVLGAVDQGGSGCACPENVLIRALVTDLILYKDDTLIMDMEAGVEHLGRATTRGVDAMVIVVEPGQRSLDSAGRIMSLGRDIGLSRFFIVANKVSGQKDEVFVRESIVTMRGAELIGIIPLSETIRSSDRTGMSVIDGMDHETLELFKGILGELESRIRDGSEDNKDCEQGKNQDFPEEGGPEPGEGT